MMTTYSRTLLDEVLVRLITDEGPRIVIWTDSPSHASMTFGRLAERTHTLGLSEYGVTVRNGVRELRMRRAGLRGNERHGVPYGCVRVLTRAPGVTHHGLRPTREVEADALLDVDTYPDEVPWRLEPPSDLERLSDWIGVRVGRVRATLGTRERADCSGDDRCTALEHAHDCPARPTEAGWRELLLAEVERQDGLSTYGAAGRDDVRIALACMQDELDETLEAFQAEKRPKEGRTWARTRAELEQAVAIGYRLLRDLETADPTRGGGRATIGAPRTDTQRPRCGKKPFRFAPAFLRRRPSSRRQPSRPAARDATAVPPVGDPSREALVGGGDGSDWHGRVIAAAAGSPPRQETTVPDLTTAFAASTIEAQERLDELVARKLALVQPSPGPDAGSVRAELEGLVRAVTAAWHPNVTDRRRVMAQIGNLERAIATQEEALVDTDERVEALERSCRALLRSSTGRQRGRIVGGRELDALQLLVIGEV